MLTTTTNTNNASNNRTTNTLSEADAQLARATAKFPDDMPLSQLLFLDDMPLEQLLQSKHTHNAATTTQRHAPQHHRKKQRTQTDSTYNGYDSTHGSAPCASTDTPDGLITTNSHDRNKHDPTNAPIHPQTNTLQQRLSNHKRKSKQHHTAPPPPTTSNRTKARSPTPPQPCDHNDIKMDDTTYYDHTNNQHTQSDSTSSSSSSSSSSAPSPPARSKRQRTTTANNCPNTHSNHKSQGLASRTLVPKQRLSAVPTAANANTAQTPLRHAHTQHRCQHHQHYRRIGSPIPWQLPWLPVECPGILLFQTGQA